MRLRLALVLGLAAFPALAQEDGWTRFLPQTAPAIRACLQGEAGAAATAALPMNRGRVLVRFARTGGERMECVAELGPPGRPARRESTEPLGAAPPLPGEDGRRVTLERLCPDAAELRDEAGQPAGWLNPAACR